MVITGALEERLSRVEVQVSQLLLREYEYICALYSLPSLKFQLLKWSSLVSMVCILISHLPVHYRTTFIGRCILCWIRIHFWRSICKLELRLVFLALEQWACKYFVFAKLLNLSRTIYLSVFFMNLWLLLNTFVLKCLFYWIYGAFLW